VTIKLKPCPFCSKVLDPDNPDTIYPSGIYWRETEYGRCYVSHKERLETDGKCMQIVCNESQCGCGAEMHGDSVEEVVDKWNRRA
jgi:hypothetical protein